ncbi:hypothetical protein ATE92_1544 [Ulvibacter sp. MAR_2010_11]|uniref:hypothetical protein n=1 Tax=Ulvibacter sp. MAR_2010_11 TaxID=1250229 RepID=UPI000CB0C178|nr:hypothetical protein [Ulvibacter sp. MAR_2010_11]PKA83392.1 hypothetical protein ATE92_1544 [Ulvibacter sp. MAR_2010_11]
MKNLLMIALLFFGYSAFAQHPEGDKKEMHTKRQELTPQQAATLRTKQLTLQLDLTEAQQKEIEKVELARATKRKEMMASKKDRKELTTDEKVALKSKMLDDRIEMKKKMKSILTEVQFEKWEKSVQNKRGRKDRHRNKEGSPKNK